MAVHKYKRVVVGENGIKPTDWIFVCPAGSLLPTGCKLNFAGSEKQIVQMAMLFNVEPEFIWSGREPLTVKYSEVAVKYARLNKRDQNLVDQIMEGLQDDDDDQGAEIDPMPNKNGNGKK